MNIKRNVVFCVEHRKKDGVPIIENVPIRMRVMYAGKRVEFSTGYRIDMDKWDGVKERVKPRRMNKLMQSAGEINADLMRYYTEIQNAFKEFEMKGVVPSPKQLRDTFDRRTGTGRKVRKANPSKEDTSLLQAFDDFVNECGDRNDWTDATYGKFAALRKKIEEFKKDASFEFFNEDGFNEFLKFLRDKKRMRNSTIGKQIGFLKWFIRWSYNKGYHKNAAFNTFKPKLKNTSKKVIFLTWEELEKLKTCKIPKEKEYLEPVRDVFLFCCYTGLRYSDVHNLCRSDIRTDRIVLTTVKTADSLSIELNDHSRSILAKYEDIYFEDGKALPVISNQRMNIYLKELTKLAEIDNPVRITYYRGNKRIDEFVPKNELITTHAGRRTFICNALSLGIPPQVIMKWTGHSDYTAMKPYIDIADSVKAEAMKKFNNSNNNERNDSWKE